MRGFAPSPVTRWLIGLLVGIVFAIPLVATLLYTLESPLPGYSLERWAGLFDPANAPPTARSGRDSATR